ncbi:hypothetical protein RRG08_029753 [Elysia crispata]|uniref:Uncharacterized protein n=1 Tax=Elysia crispata TaxID=231223 RepID=A0AAE1B6T6_9GAST|nr:hypothetical protein RRG08_029753 [Elysia crispata]
MLSRIKESSRFCAPINYPDDYSVYANSSNSESLFLLSRALHPRSMAIIMVTTDVFEEPCACPCENQCLLRCSCANAWLIWEGKVCSVASRPCYLNYNAHITH